MQGRIRMSGAPWVSQLEPESCKADMGVSDDRLNMDKTCILELDIARQTKSRL